MKDEITTQDAQYALDLVNKICAEVGPGIPGTPQERQRAAIIKGELETHLGSENVTEEEFTLAPDAYLTTYPALFCMFAAILLNVSIGRFSGIPLWIPSLAALVFSIIIPLLFVFEFVLSYEIVDPFFPKKQSTNVVGKLRKPGVDSVKRVLILSGHHDSAFENTWLRFTGVGFYILSVIFFFGVITLVVMCLIQFLGLLIGNESMIQAGTLGWVLIVFPIAPSVVYALFLTRGRRGGGIVPGAADNLSACSVVVSMCRFLANNLDQIPDDVEIRFISFGSEEAGLRGSRRYVERHLEELYHLDARLLNYEVIVHPEIAILNSDVNGTVRNSPEMVRSAVAAAQRARVPYKVSAAVIGVASDAASFNRSGLKAVTLMPFKVPQQFMAFYHQSKDTPDVLSIEPLLNVLKLTLEWVRAGGV